MNKYNWKGINYPSKIDDLKSFEKNNPTIAINILFTKEKEHFQLIFQSITQPAKKKNFLTTPNKEKEGWHYLEVINIYIIKRNNIKKS